LTITRIKLGVKLDMNTHHLMTPVLCCDAPAILSRETALKS